MQLEPKGGGRGSHASMTLGLFATGVEDAVNRVLNLYLDVSPRRWDFTEEHLWDNTPLDARKRLLVEVLKDLGMWDEYKGIDKRIENLAKYRNRLAHSIVVVPFSEEHAESPSLQLMGRAHEPVILSPELMQVRMRELMDLVGELERLIGEMFQASSRFKEWGLTGLPPSERGHLPPPA